MPWFGIGGGGSGGTTARIAIEGSVANASGLPATADTGNAYITRDTGHLWVYDGTSFVDSGPIVGPPGSTPTFIAGNITPLAPGSAPTVDLVRLSTTSYRMDFSLPQGDTVSGGARPSYTHRQPTPAVNWVFSHDLAFNPTDMKINDYSAPDADWSVPFDYDPDTKTYVLHFPFAVAGDVTVY